MQLAEEQRKAITESHRIVRQAFHDAEKAVRQRRPDELIDVVQAHALANDLINDLRKHLGMLALS